MAEKEVKKTARKQMDVMGTYLFFPATGGYGTSGVPDIVGAYEGMFFGCECKTGKKEPTALQWNQIDLILAAGGFAWWVNESNMKDVDHTLRRALAFHQSKKSITNMRILSIACSPECERPA